MKKLIPLFIFLSIFILTGCKTNQVKEITITDQDVIEDKVPKENIIIRKVNAGSFANWVEEEISFEPSVPAYSFDLDISDKSKSNIVLNDSIFLGPDQTELINKNGFFINQNSINEFFEIYESNRYQLIPNFITTDSVLHTYHLFFNHLLESLENDLLYESAQKESQQMVEASLKHYETLKGSDFETAALSNVAYFSVANRLLDPNFSIPAIVEKQVLAELKLIEDHAGITNSTNIFTDPEYKEDYSQYIPRGHYTKSEKLQKYFNSLMWYGRITFRLKDENETKSALLIVEILNNNSEIFDNWEKLYEPINFFVGEPDDLSFYEYYTVAKDIYGENFTTSNLMENPENFSKFVEEAKTLADPKINSMPIFSPDFQPNDRTEEIKGFRFLGQRSTVDAMIFQKLIFRDVEQNPDGDLRMLPNALDIPAVFGSPEAYEILEELGATEFERYTENFEDLQKAISEFPTEQWGKNLYWGWTNTLRALLQNYGEGYPSFMTNEAWKKKELVTFLGSWTELKHDTILYAKQVYAELGGGPSSPEEVDDRGYVEPNPILYNRLKSLINLTISGLEQRNLLNEKDKQDLLKLEEMVTKIRDISIKELENKELSEEEYEFIRTYGGSLEHFWHETLSDSDKDKNPENLLNDHPAAIVADIATDPNGFVLEEAIGGINKIYVVFPIEDELHIGVGGVYSHYEFPWPLNDRLTNEKWRQILYPYEDPEYDYKNSEDQFTPEIAEWQKEFTYLY